MVCITCEPTIWSFRTVRGSSSTRKPSVRTQFGLMLACRRRCSSSKRSTLCLPIPGSLSCLTSTRSARTFAPRKGPLSLVCESGKSGRLILVILLWCYQVPQGMEFLPYRFYWCKHFRKAQQCPNPGCNAAHSLDQLTLKPQKEYPVFCFSDNGLNEAAWFLSQEGELAAFKLFKVESWYTRDQLRPDPIVIDFGKEYSFEVWSLIFRRLLDHIQRFDYRNLDPLTKITVALKVYDNLLPIYKDVERYHTYTSQNWGPLDVIKMPPLNITSASFTCLVCFELASLDAAIACGNDEPFDDDLTLKASDPCSSTDAPQTPVQHKFCTECIQRHAEAAAESMPLSECGTGLKCMEHGCKQPLLFSRVRNVLPKKTMDLLENRVLAKNLAAFGDIEKCPKCNFAVAMEAPKEVDKVFRCLRCKSSWCRLCELPWNDDHVGQTCDEAALKIGVQKKQRDLERMASEAVMRKCHRCNLVFTKDEGCNRITCRCRATQCFICRAKDIDYTHFCRHPLIPLTPRTCCQKCLLWENPKTVDENAIIHFGPTASKYIAVIEDRCHNTHLQKAPAWKSCSLCQLAFRFGSEIHRCDGCEVMIHVECRENMPKPCIPYKPPCKDKAGGLRIVDYCADLRPRLPFVVLRCVRFVDADLHKPGLYTSNPSGVLGDNVLTVLHQEQQKSMQPLKDYDSHAVAECLLAFLRNVRDPVIPEVSHSDFFAAGTENPDDLEVCIVDLPAPHKNTLAYLFLHWQRVLGNADRNLIELGMFVRVIANAVMRVPHECKAATDVVKRLLAIDKSVYERVLEIDIDS